MALRHNKKGYRRACNLFCSLEPLVGIEPTTCSLRVSCSTPEPQRQNLIQMFGEEDSRLPGKADNGSICLQQRPKHVNHPLAGVIDFAN